MLKKILSISLALTILLQPAFSAFTPLLTEKKAVKASEFMIPIDGGKSVSLQDLATMSTDQLQSLTGRKMNLLEKIAFKSSQKKLQKNINEDGTLNTKMLDKLKKAGTNATGGFSIGGFLLGIFLSLIGVLIAYIITDFKNTSLTKWAWIGTLISIVLGLLLF